MGIRTGYDAPLGMPTFGVAHDDSKGIAPGTVITGYDDVAGTSSEYIWLASIAGIASGDDVDFTGAYVVTEVAADTGMADAIVASGAGQYAWFKLKQNRAG